MKTKNLVFGISIIVLLILTGCAADKTSDALEMFTNRDIELEFDLSKEKSFFGDIYYLHLRTKSHCCGIYAEGPSYCCSIIAETKVNQDEITVEIKFEPALTIEEGHAISKQKLGRLKGIYYLILKHDDKKDLYKLNISEGIITVTEINSTKIRYSQERECLSYPLDICEKDPDCFIGIGVKQCQPKTSLMKN